MTTTSISPCTTTELTSSAFDPLGDIPSQHTCDGHDRSPPLAWSGVPSGAKSLALVVDDPDAPDPAAPKMTWVHWVLYNIPPATTGFEAGATQLPAGTCQGINDWQQAGYRGPLPTYRPSSLRPTRCTRSTPPCRFCTRRPKPPWNRPCRGISWPAASWWGITRRSDKQRRHNPPAPGKAEYYQAACVPPVHRHPSERP